MLSAMQLPLPEKVTNVVSNVYNGRYSEPVRVQQLSDDAEELKRDHDKLVALVPSIPKTDLINISEIHDRSEEVDL